MTPDLSLEDIQDANLAGFILLLTDFVCPVCANAFVCVDGEWACPDCPEVA
jgi:rubrerythrin